MPAPTRRSSVLSRRFLTLLMLTVPVAAAGEEQTPQQLLAAIYDPYKKPDFKGQPYWQADRFFAPDLARAIVRDFAEAEKRKEVPDARRRSLHRRAGVEGRIARLRPLPRSRATRAAGAVALVSLGTPKGLALTLVKTPAGWRISDIVSANGSLRALFKLK